MKSEIYLQFYFSVLFIYFFYFSVLDDMLHISVFYFPHWNKRLIS